MLSLKCTYYKRNVETIDVLQNMVFKQKSKRHRLEIRIYNLPAEIDFDFRKYIWFGPGL